MKMPRLKESGPLGAHLNQMKGEYALVKENVAFNWSIRGYPFFRQGDSICLLIWFAILTCLIALDDHLIVLLTLA